MKKMFLLSLLSAFFLTGCLARTYSIQKERLDQGISGNVGYIYGTPPAEAMQPPAKTHRQINVMEVELGK